MRFWKPDDVYESPCAHCGKPVEFFKDDLRRKCPHCHKYTVNPRNNLGCAAWCKFGADCLAQIGRMRTSDAADEEGNGTEQK